MTEMMIIKVTGPLVLFCLSLKVFYNYSFICTLSSLAFFLKYVLLKDQQIGNMRAVFAVMVAI